MLADRLYFASEDAALSHMEAVLWPDGAVCPHCGGTGRGKRLNGVKRRDGTVRKDLWKCYTCRKQFTVRVGTNFESMHLPAHKLLQAIYLIDAHNKRGIVQILSDTLEITYRAAWFITRRLRASSATPNVS